MDFSIPSLSENRSIGFNAHSHLHLKSNQQDDEKQRSRFSLEALDSIRPSRSTLDFQSTLSNLEKDDQNEPFRLIYSSIHLPSIKPLHKLEPLPPLTPLPTLPSRYQSKTQSQSKDSSQTNSTHQDKGKQKDTIETQAQARLLSWDQFHRESQQPSTSNLNHVNQSPFLTDWRPSRDDGKKLDEDYMSSEDINEALLQSLDPRYAFDDPSTSTSDPSKINPRPAPSYSSSSVLSSLLITVSSTISSTHFHWEESLQRFGWSGTIEREIKRLKSTDKSKPKSRDQNFLDLPILPWKGSERIRGYSQSTSDSIIERFLKVSTHFRRLEIKVQELRNEKGSCPEAHSLGFSLETVLGWLREELRNWAEEVRKNDKGAGILMAWKGLEESEEILNSLAEMMSCSYDKRPPFKPIPNSSSTTSILSHVHSYLLASISSHSSLLLQAILSYMLEHSSRSWRIDVASWIGWPGARSEKEDFESKINTESNSERVGKAEPWSGVEVEWGNDERGEEDIEFILRPSRIPAFLNTSNARDLLEAGRALRLLKKAAPDDHPLLKLVGYGSSDTLERSMSVPGWIWNEKDSDVQSQKVEERVKDLRREVAKWRNRKGDGSSIPPTSDPVSDPSSNETKLQVVPLNSGTMVLDLISDEEGNFGLSSLSRMLALFNSNPGSLDSQFTSTSESNPISIVSKPRTEFYQHLAKILIPLHSSNSNRSQSQSHFNRSILPDSISSLPTLTKRVFVSPLLQWSSLVNSALISVFFRDLGLGIYLETCRQFLLLGSHNFYETVRETLFDGDGADKEKDEEENVETGRRNGIGLSRKLNNCISWPPTGSELTSTLMSAVVETVSDMRSNDARRIALAQEQGLSSNLTGTTIALKDLDERLSFAISRPERKKGDPKNWKDPQSIEALDWLSLSFFPPPLISPLLTQHASMTYQRIFNFLLRIMRVQSALRGLTLDTFKSSTDAKLSFRKKGARIASTKFNLLPFEDHPKSRDLLLRFKHEAQHFHNALGSFVSDIAVNDSWQRFQSRLTQLSKDAEARDHASYHGRDEEGQEDEEDLQDGRTEVDGQEQEQEQEGTNTFQLKDVFSLARYHERVLDGILQTCFLKARQKGVMKMITDLQQLTLDLALLIRSLKLSSLPSTPSQQFELSELYRKFYSRFSQFVKTLNLLKDRSSGLSIKSHFEKSRLSELERNQKEMEAGLGYLDPKRATELELERQELETWRDLELLEGNNKKSGKEKEVVEMLLSRLDVLGQLDKK